MGGSSVAFEEIVGKSGSRRHFATVEYVIAWVPSTLTNLVSMSRIEGRFLEGLRQINCLSIELDSRDFLFKQNWEKVFSAVSIEMSWMSIAPLNLT
jgi:hypothetical protein